MSCPSQTAIPDIKGRKRTLVPCLKDADHEGWHKYEEKHRPQDKGLVVIWNDASGRMDLA